MPTIFVNGKQRQYDRGTTFEQIARDVEKEPAALEGSAGKKAKKYKGRPALCYFNGKMQELTKKVEKDGVLTVITTAEKAGHSAYGRTAAMMMVVAARNILGKTSDGKYRTDIRLKVEFTLGHAFYISVLGDLVPGQENTAEDLSDLADKINAEMKRLYEADLPIGKKTYPIDDAISLFARQEMVDKEKLFHFRRSSTVNVYTLDGYYDYYYGYMLPSTGYVDKFYVQQYEEGLLLNLPASEDMTVVPEFVPEEKLYDQLMLNTEWGNLVEISTIGDLNEKICEGNISDMILVQEALQERRIGDIAEQIYEKEDVKFVLIAGPSSSGKTTFAHRLSVQLRSFGLRPHIISMDNWFVNREKTPVDEDGNYNFDVLEAIDLDLFNDDMNALLEGEEIELPTFDFKAGKRKYNGDKMRLGENDILVIEGIHGLNPASTAELPEKNKFRIYISALTSLNIDEHNRIPTSDTRLLRRIVRDARTRGSAASGTINGWRKVRDGEEKYIFPFQQNVDAVFNSVLIYEQAVLKQYAEPLLFAVSKDDPAYYEAKRLLKFLDYFVGVDTAAVPTNSICREFVGGGCFGQ